MTEHSLGATQHSRPVMPASRLAAELGHTASVKRVKVQFPYRLHLRVTDDGLSRTDMNTIREYGWEVSGFSRRSGCIGVSVVCEDLRGGRDV